MSDATNETPQATTQGAEQTEVKQDQAGLAAPSQENAAKPEAAPKVVPEKYDLKLPDQTTLDASDLERIAADAKAQGLSQEDAQKMVNRDNQTLAAYAEKQQESMAKARSAWVEAVKTDKEFGGESLPKSLELAKRALEQFGSDEFRSALEETGLGDHPELVRVFYRIGKLMANDSFVVGAGSSTLTHKSIAEVLYPNQSKEK